MIIDQKTTEVLQVTPSGVGRASPYSTHGKQQPSKVQSQSGFWLTGEEFHLYSQCISLQM